MFAVHCVGSVIVGSVLGLRSALIQANHVQKRAHDPEVVVLGEESLLVEHPGFQVIDALYIGNLRVTLQRL